LNIIFPRAGLPDAVVDGYLLQRVGLTQLQSVLLLNVNKLLIDEFISVMKLHVPVIAAPQ